MCVYVWSVYMCAHTVCQYVCVPTCGRVCVCVFVGDLCVFGSGCVSGCASGHVCVCVCVCVSVWLWRVLACQHKGPVTWC